MPLLTGPLAPAGAVIDVLIGVSRPRRALLPKHQFRVPAPVQVRAVIDTGVRVRSSGVRLLGPDAGRTSFHPHPIHSIQRPTRGRLFDVSLSLVAGGVTNPFPDTRVMAADCWHPDEGIEALLGRDILDRCFFRYMGPDRRFTLAF